MKNMKFLKRFVFIFLITLMGCEDEERNLEFLNSIAIPSNIATTFSVTTDNSGTVTIFPTGDGAYSFEVDFGDTSDPVSIINGESTTHVFAEGSYNVSVTGVNLKGEKSDPEVTPLVVSFIAPENLVVEIENDAATSRQVNVTVNADFAIMYEFYSGETGVTQPVASANIGETLSYIYDAPGTYDYRVVVKGAAIETTEFTGTFEVTEILEPTEASPVPPVRNVPDVVSIFSDAYDDVTLNELPTTWSDGAFEAVTLHSDNMWKIAAAEFIGIVTNYGSGIDVSQMEYMHIDYWVPDVETTELNVKIVNTVDGGEDIASLGTTVGGSWQSVDIPMTEFDQGNLANKEKITQILIDPAARIDILYVDNFYFWKEPSVFNDVPVNFEDSNINYTWNGFGDPGFGPIPANVVSNPDQSGINATSTVLQIDKPAGSQVWAGASMALDNPIDFATNGTTLTIKVWSPRAGVDILFKTEDVNSPPDGNGNPTVFAEVIATTTKAMEWEELVFDMTTFGSFSTAISYHNVIIFPDFGNSGQGESFYFDDIEFASKKFPLSFEIGSLTYDWAGFGDPNFAPIPTSIEANPSQTGINTSATVLKVDKPLNSQVWAGASLAFDGPIDFSYGTTVKVKVWSPRAGVTILLKTEDLDGPRDGNGNPTVFAEVTATTTGANQWEELTFDLTSFGAFSTSIEYDNIIVFPDFGNGGQGESFYFDDFILTNN